MKNRSKLKKSTKKNLKTRLTWASIGVTIFLVSSIYVLLKSGSGPLSFLASNLGVNEIKTLCTRRMDGKKVCTEYSTTTDGGIKTTNTKTQVIDGSAGGGKVEYEYKVEKKTDAATGTSTTTEVRSKVNKDDGEQKELSKIVTVQDKDNKVISDTRTGDFSVGITVDKSTSTTETVSPEQPIVPKSTTSTGVNCDKGTCGTNGSPVCYGSYVMTGAGFGGGTSDRECTLCGDNGKGGVGYTGSSESCKTLLANGAPVVLGFDVDPNALGLPKETKTASCFSKRGGDWIQVPAGHPGEGPNEGKYCGVNGSWSREKPAIAATPETKTPTVSLSAEAQCHTQHPGYIFGKNLAGVDVCLPNTAINRATISVNAPCKPGKSTLGGKDVYVSCSSTGAPSYTFCSGGTFDSKGNCISSSTNVAPETCASSGAKQCSIVCGGLGKYTCDSQGGNCKCNNPGEIVTQTTPASIKQPNELLEARNQSYENYSECAKETVGICKADPNDSKKYVSITFNNPTPNVTVLPFLRQPSDIVAAREAIYEDYTTCSSNTMGICKVNPNGDYVFITHNSVVQTPKVATTKKIVLNKEDYVVDTAESCSSGKSLKVGGNTTNMPKVEFWCQTTDGHYASPQTGLAVNGSGCSQNSKCDSGYCEKRGWLGIDIFALDQCAPPPSRE